MIFIKYNPKPLLVSTLNTFFYKYILSCNIWLITRILFLILFSFGNSCTCRTKPKTRKFKYKQDNVQAIATQQDSQRTVWQSKTVYSIQMEMEITFLGYFERMSKETPFWLYY